MQPPSDDGAFTPSYVRAWDDVDSSQVQWSDDALTDLGSVLDDAISAGKASVRRLPGGLIEETSPLHVCEESPRAIEGFRQLCVALGDYGEKDAIPPNLITLAPMDKPSTRKEQSKAELPKAPAKVERNKRTAPAAK